MSFRPIILALFFSLSFSVTSCDFVYHLIQKEGAEEKEVLGEVIPFFYNPAVEKIQKLLKLHGYAVGTIDGKMGATTRHVVAKFQEDHNLTVSRFVDRATWAALNIFEETGMVVDGEINYKVVQTALKNAGLPITKIDGKAGPQTQNALREFQKSQGLQPDGKIGPKTLNKLVEFLPAE